jgi:sigma-B regulation protein RsbU (phosphoserine phosphatase)
MERRVDAQYATLLIAQWERKKGLLVLANAGAEPPLIYRRGEILKPRVEGVPIGLLEDREYEELEFALEPGDTILFYSDGVEDQLNAKEEDYSRARVQKLLTKKHAEAPQAIADAYFAELDKFRGATAITDDQTVVAMRLTQ